MNADGDEQLTPTERQHLRHRERKRATPMVVDNAGVKRIARALAQKRTDKARSRERSR